MQPTTGIPKPQFFSLLFKFFGNNTIKLKEEDRVNSAIWRRQLRTEFCIYSFYFQILFTFAIS